MQFGLSTRGRQKRLTFDAQGLTNSTCLLMDGNRLLFGQKPFRCEDGTSGTGGWEGEWLGRWRSLKTPLGKDATGRERLGTDRSGPTTK